MPIFQLVPQYNDSEAGTDSTATMPGPGRTVGKGIAIAGEAIEQWVDSARAKRRERRQMKLRNSELVFNNSVAPPTHQIIFFNPGQHSLATQFLTTLEKNPQSHRLLTDKQRVVCHAISCLQHLLELLPDSVYQSFMPEIRSIAWVVQTTFLGHTHEVPDPVVRLAKDPVLQRWIELITPELDSDPAFNYTLKSLGRMCSSDYVPTDQDITVENLSQGYPKIPLKIRNSECWMLDVAAHKRDCMKWLNSCGDFTAVVFWISLLDYSQIIEPGRVSQLCTTINLFKQLPKATSRLSPYRIILFIYEPENFASTLDRVPLVKYFPAYTGGNDTQQARRFIIEIFRKLLSSTQRQSFYVINVNSNHSSLVACMRLFFAIISILLL